MTNKQNADASESFRQLMAAYSKAFSSTPDSVKEEENADDTATTTENGTTPSPRTASILDADDETTENGPRIQPRTSKTPESTKRTGARGTSPENQKT